MQAIEELYRLQHYEDDLCCEGHKDIYKTILLRLTLLNDNEQIIKFADAEWQQLTKTIHVNTNTINKLIKKYQDLLYRSYFASWKSFTKSTLVRKRMSNWLNKRQILSKRRVYTAWKLETERNCCIRGERCVTEAIKNVQINLINEISGKTEIHNNYKSDIKKLVETRRRLDHDVHQIQLTLNHISKEAQDVKIQYAEAETKRKEDLNKYNTKIEELKLLIAHEGMMVSEYERHIHEKEELLLENQLKKKKKKRKKKKGNTHVQVKKN